jgi:voltage-gated potassium channel
MKNKKSPFMKGDVAISYYAQETIKRFLSAAFSILAVLLIGTMGYVLLEGWSSLDALYMTVITIATVGYGEVAALSLQGRIFTIFLIFLGIGVAGYAIGTIAAFLVEGHMIDLLKGRKMAKEITKLKDHIIICGYGKDFIVIDLNPDRVEEAIERGYLAYVGEATDDDILEKCGIRNARGLISAITSDSANLYLVITARALKPALRIIAKGLDEGSRKKMIRAGADRVVSPFEIAAQRMTALMIRPDIVEFMEAFAPDRYFGLRLEKVQLSKRNRLSGKRLDESYIKRDTDGAMVLGIQKPGKPLTINPPGSTVLEENDTLIAIGNDDQLSRLRELAG